MISSHLLEWLSPLLAAGALSAYAGLDSSCCFWLLLRSAQPLLRLQYLSRQGRKQPSCDQCIGSLCTSTTCCFLPAQPKIFLHVMLTFKKFLACSVEKWKRAFCHVGSRVPCVQSEKPTPLPCTWPPVSLPWLTLLLFQEHVTKSETIPLAVSLVEITRFGVLRESSFITRLY